MLWLQGVKTPEFKRVKGVHPVVTCFEINISGKLFHHPPDRFSPNFYHMAGT